MSRLWIAVAVIVLATGGLWASKARTPKVDADRIRAHVKYLASDELEGRGTGQKGGERAAAYVAQEFSSYGLLPAGENGTYFQNVPMVGVKTLPETVFVLAPANGEEIFQRQSAHLLRPVDLQV